MSGQKKRGDDSDSDSSVSSRRRSDSSRSSSEDERRPAKKSYDSDSSSSSESMSPRKPARSGSSSSAASAPKKKYSSSSSSDSESEDDKPPARGPAKTRADSSSSDSEEDVKKTAPTTTPAPVPATSIPSVATTSTLPTFPQIDNSKPRNSIKGIPLDLSLIKKMQEAEAKVDKPFIPNTLTRESSSSSSESDTDSPVTPKAVVIETKAKTPSPKPSPKKLSRSPSISSASTVSSLPKKRSKSPASVSTRSSRRTRTHSPSPSRSSSESPPRKHSKGKKSVSSYSRSRSPSSRSSYSGRKNGSDSESDVSTSSYSYSSASVVSKEMKTVKKDRYPALREWYSDLPEPGDLMALKNISDPYLQSVHDNIASLHSHIRSSIQHQEEELLDQYVYDLSKFDGSMNRKEDERRLKFLRDLEKIRTTRKQFRGMLFDSVRERSKAIESKTMQSKQDRELARKIEDLKPHKVIDAFTSIFFIFQVIIILFFIIFIDFSPVSDELILKSTATYYRFYSSIAFMLFVGYAFMGSFLKKNVYSAISLVFMVGVLAIQWGILWNYWWMIADRGSLVKLLIAAPDYINGLYAAVTCAISFSVLIGRANPMQAVVMVFFECFFYALNVFVNTYKLRSVDVGGSILIHTFGAFFGIFASIGLMRKNAKNPVDILDKSPVYRNDVAAVFGTLFLWVLFPSFNSALAALDQRAQAIVNTILALAASTTIATSVSFMRGPDKYRLVMEDVRNATLAGGIAIAASANLIVSPWAAILAGMLSGLLSVICNWKFGPYLAKKIALRESRPVVALHAVIGLAGGIISVIATGGANAGAVRDWEMHFYEDNLAAYIPRGAIQPGIQIAAIFITLGIASLSGFVTGIFMWWFRDKRRAHHYTDEHLFDTPDDYQME